MIFEGGPKLLCSTQANRRLSALILISILLQGCEPKLEIKQENLWGSWQCLDEYSGYAEMHFNDTAYVIQTEESIAGFYYWIENDTLLRANGKNARTPIAIIERVTKDKIFMNRPGFDFELLRINDATPLAFQMLGVDSLKTQYATAFKNRARGFYSKYGRTSD